MKWFNYTIVAIIVATLIGCGGGGSSNSNKDTTKAIKKWHLPEKINNTRSPIDEDKVAINNSGDIIVVWTQISGSVKNLYTKIYTKSSGWSSIKRISAGTSNVSEINVAINDTGDAVAVWREFYDGAWSIFARRYLKDSGWQSIKLMEHSGGNAGYPKVKIDSSGNIVVAWIQNIGAYWNLYYNRFTVSDSRWDIPRLVEFTPNNVNRFDIDIDGSGNLIIVWQQVATASSNNLYSKILSEAGILSVASKLNDSANRMYNPKVAINSSGDAIATWQQVTGSNMYIYAKRYSGRWSDLEQLNTRYNYGSYPSIGIDDNGNIVSIWKAYDRASSKYKLISRYYNGSRWSDLKELDTLFSTSELKVATSASGESIAIWTKLHAGIPSVYTSRKNGNQDWSKMEKISGDRGSRYIYIAINDNGEAVAIWKEDDGSGRGIDELYINRYY